MNVFYYCFSGICNKKTIVRKGLSGKTIVLKKLEAASYGTRMSKKDLLDFAETLSNKKRLLEVYLHTDFQEAYTLQKKIKNLKVEESTKPNLLQSASEEITVEEDVNSIKQKNNAVKLNDVNIQLTEKTFKKNEPLRIKFIVAETSKNSVEKSIKKLIAPIITSLDISPEFGMFHIALAVGPWKLEWNTSALCIPRRVTGKASLLCADLGTIASLEELDKVRNTLADVIVKWNTTMTYKNQANPEKEKAGNCQHFIFDVMNALGLSEKLAKFPPPLKNYLNTLRDYGYGEMEFDVEKELAEKFNITKGKRIFKTHKELDEFVNSFIKKDREFQYNYQYEYCLLKSFDRAFWMRHLINKDVTQYQPYVDSNHLVACPFGDPTERSILELNVKR